MGLFVFLRNIKTAADLLQLVRNYLSKDVVKICSFVILVVVWLCKILLEKDSNEPYQLANERNAIASEMRRLVKTCGDKSSIMISVVSIDKKGVIDYFYSCDGKACPINAKETNEAYNTNRVIDETTYRYLQEIGLSNQMQIIDLQENSLITMPVSKQKVELSELHSLNEILKTSDWYNLGILHILKLSAIVNYTDSVIYTISFTGQNDCLASNNGIASLKDKINQSRAQNAFYHP